MVEPGFDVPVALLALHGAAVTVALFQCRVHGGVFDGEDAADATEAVFDDPPAVMVTPDCKSGRLDSDGRAVGLLLSSIERTKAWTSSREKRIRYPAHIGFTVSEVGASGKPGAVQSACHPTSSF
ncbi:hypothetical protein GB928_004420 [Shinella curvata]|uniref:Uncharacterized protein n=1 Tax=Shinella curvata TaxID=1817964 RepID=A0ABT8X9R6_9HYPH|nr:hypothetical protein [Shinella curvata]MCJ8055183.1 hypothetical protein [Shinella curvata]MDO6120421.1 hypothetical protein [Shinella curvata]